MSLAPLAVLEGVVGVKQLKCKYDNNFDVSVLEEKLRQFLDEGQEELSSSEDQEVQTVIVSRERFKQM